MMVAPSCASTTLQLHLLPGSTALDGSKRTHQVSDGWWLALQGIARRTATWLQSDASLHLAEDESTAWKVACEQYRRVMLHLVQTSRVVEDSTTT
jgi:hypothetical protein